MTDLYYEQNNSKETTQHGRFGQWLDRVAADNVGAGGGNWMSVQRSQWLAQKIYLQEPKADRPI